MAPSNAYHLPPMLRTPHQILTLLCAATVLGCTDESTSRSSSDVLGPQFDRSGAESGPSASGHANFINAAGQLIQRTFHARQKTDGDVYGDFVQHNTVTGAIVKGDIDCLFFLGPTQAAMSGKVRENPDVTLIGRTAIFRVGDNGEGSNAQPDEISGLNIQGSGSTLDCKTFVNPFFTPIESGNIQVKP